LRRIFTVFGWKTCFWIFWENNIPIRATKEKLDGLVEVKKDGILDGLGDG